MRSGTEELFVGIDLGTSGCRAVAVDAAGRVRGTSAVALPAPLRDGAQVEQDPTLWWEGVCGTLANLSAQVPLRNARALAIDGTSATLLLADAAGTPLGPALMYNDARATAEAERIARIAPRGSAAHGATSALAKLLWLQRRHPGARYALHQADWITGRLSGRFGISDENNCLKLGYDAVARGWPEWLERLGVQSGLLPEVTVPGTDLGTILPEFAVKFRISTSCRIVTGTTDSTAACLAAGVTAPGEAVTSLGSTLVVKVMSPVPVFAPEYGVYSHRLGDLWLAGGASNSGGAVLLRHFSRERLEALTPLLQPERATDLDYYPLAAPGERFPVNDPHWPPRLEPRPDDDAVFLQGMLEGMAQIERRAYRLLEELGAPYPRVVYSTGGGARNEAWRRIRERLLGVPVIVAEHEDAAYGAALLALRGVQPSS